MGILLLTRVLSEVKANQISPTALCKNTPSKKQFDIKGLLSKFIHLPNFTKLPRGWAFNVIH